MATTRGQRLRIARERLFKSARLAANAMRIPVSTYGAHERAEAPGGRDYGPNEAKTYARRFRVTPEWLLTGRGEQPESDEGLDIPPPPQVRVVGYVGAGAEAHFYDVAPGDLDEVDPAGGVTDRTVCVEIRGDSLGAFFNRWLVFYDDVHEEVTPDLIGELCVVGLPDQRVLIKQIQRSRAEGLFNLLSSAQPPIRDVAITWAAKVNIILRRGRA